MTGGGHEGEIRIAPAGVEDLPAVVALCADHAAYERSAFDPSGLCGRLQAAITGHPPRLVVLLARTERALLGYAAFSSEFSTWSGADILHLDCLYVTAPARGQGVGRRLFNAVLAHAADLGVPRIEWQTPDWNEGAVRFYRALGSVGAAKVRFRFDMPMGVGVTATQPERIAGMRFARRGPVCDPTGGK